MKIIRILVPVTLALLSQQSRGQATDYLYAIMNDAGSFHLDEILINGSAGSQSLSQSKLLDLNSQIAGFGSAGRFGENVNGLAVDAANQRAYFNYTYGDGTSNNTGNYHFQLYSAKYDSGSWVITTVGDPLSAPIAGISTPETALVSDGAFPRGAFLNGDYYTGGQISGGLIRLNLNPDGSAATDFVEQWLDPDHGAHGNSSGGDLIFDHDGNVLLSSVFTSNQYNLVYIQTLNDAMALTGAESQGYYLEGLIPRSVHGAVQIGGYGDSELLYGATVNDADVYQLEIGTTEFSATLIGSLDGGTVMDLSEGTKISLLVPEPTSALLLGIAGMLGLTRRKRVA